MTIQGSPKDIKDGISELTGDEQTTPQDPPEMDEKYQRFITALGSPGNRLEVKRIRPAKFPDGENAKIVVYRDECPAEIFDIEQNVFTNFGGHRYKVLVRDDNGKIVAASMIEHPDTEEPIPPVPEEDTVPPGGDPYATEFPQRGDLLDKELGDVDKEMERIHKQQVLAEKRQQLKEMKGESGVDPRDQKIRDLEKKIEDQEKAREKEKEQNAILSRLEEMDKKIEDKAQRPQNDPEIQALKDSVAEMKRSNEDLQRRLEDKKEDRVYNLMKTAFENKGDGVKELAEAIKSNNENQLLSEIRALKTDSGKPTTVEEQLKILEKMKNVLGSDNKESRIMDAAVDNLLKKATGGGDGDDENTEDDPIKFAVKEMVPAVKDLIQNEVDRKREKTGEITEEEKRKVYKQATKDVLENIRRQGFVLAPSRPQQPLPQKGQPQPKQGAQPQPAQPAQPAQGQPAQPQPQPEQKPAVKPSGFQEGAVKAPPGPESPAYDRKTTLLFVVDEIISDINKGVSDDTLVVGDAVDGLDEEFLDEVLKAKDSQGLYELLRPYVPDEKIKWIESRAERDGLVKTWLNRIVTSIQYEYRKQLAEAETAEGGDMIEEAESSVFEPSEPSEPEAEENPSGFMPG